MVTVNNGKLYGIYVTEVISEMRRHIRRLMPFKWSPRSETAVRHQAVLDYDLAISDQVVSYSTSLQQSVEWDRKQAVKWSSTLPLLQSSRKELSRDCLTTGMFKKAPVTVEHKACGSIVVKALCYKPEGRGFDTRWGEFLNLPKPSGRTRP
jgi:hypothetical protein